MIILRLLLLLTNLLLKLLSTQGTGADKLLSTQRVKVVMMILVHFYTLLWPYIRRASMSQYFDNLTLVRPIICYCSAAVNQLSREIFLEL